MGSCEVFHSTQSQRKVHGGLWGRRVNHLHRNKSFESAQSSSGKLCCIAILKFNLEAVNNASETNTGVSKDGVDDTFDVQSKISGAVKTGLWVGHCFILTNTVNRLDYYVRGI